MNADTQGFVTTMLVLFYFFPSIVAFWRGVGDMPLIILANVIFGWTGLGWFLIYLVAAGPTKEEVAHRKAAKCAQEQFYLREAEKA